MKVAMFTFRLIGWFSVVLAFSGVIVSATDRRIITKAEWTGREAAGPMEALTLPVQRVVVSHSAGSPCSDEDGCSQQVRNIQAFHMNSLHFDDVAYNFLIGDDGNVYEGRGWQHQGAFARGYNAGSLGVVFLGNFESGLPSEAALSAYRDLVEMGVANGKVASDYKLLGHRQVSSTNSPGAALYKAVKGWPHWSNQV